MLPLIETHRAEIAELCRQYGVRTLDVFGSTARETDFDPDRSDVDLLVTYDPRRPAPDLGEYFGLTEELTALLERKVDVVMSGAVRNPYIHADIDCWKQPVYTPKIEQRAEYIRGDYQEAVTLHLAHDNISNHVRHHQLIF